MEDTKMDKLIEKYNNEEFNITLDNCHIKILQFIKNKSYCNK